MGLDGGDVVGGADAGDERLDGLDEVFGLVFEVALFGVS